MSPFKLENFFLFDSKHFEFKFSSMYLKLKCVLIAVISICKAKVPI